MRLPDILGCPRCGHSVRKSMKLCPGCGWRLSVVKFTSRTAGGAEIHERLIVTDPKDPEPPPVVDHPDPFDRENP